MSHTVLECVFHSVDVRSGRSTYVLTSAEFVNLATSSRVALTPITTPRDETYRGAEVQWFAFPTVPSGEYEIAIRLADWGVTVVPQTSAIEDSGAWVSRFRID